MVAGYPDCKQWFDYGYTQSGIYPVNPDGGDAFQVNTVATGLESRKLTKLTCLCFYSL